MGHEGRQVHQTLIASKTLCQDEHLGVHMWAGQCALGVVCGRATHLCVWAGHLMQIGFHLVLQLPHIFLFGPLSSTKAPPLPPVIAHNISDTIQSNLTFIRNVPHTPTHHIHRHGHTHTTHLEALQELLGVLQGPLDPEGHHTTEAPALPLGQLVLGVGGEAGIHDLSDVGGGLQEPGHSKGVLLVLPHPEVEGLQTTVG